MKKSSWFLVFLLFAVSCLDQPECYLLNNNYIGVAFRVMGSGSLDSTKLSQVLINGIPIQSSSGDIFDKTRDSTITSLQLPVDYFNNSTLITLNSTTSQNNLTAAYQRQVQFVSEECGPRYILSKLTVPETTYDSMRIVSDTPNRSGDGRHIEIFRCPSTDTLRLVFHQLQLPATTAATSAIAGRPVGADLTNILVGETVEMYTAKRATTVDLPVNLQALQTPYTFTFSGDYGFDKPVRTMQVKYNTQKVARYPGCGEQTFVTGLTIDREFGSQPFDSISLATNSENVPRNSLTDPLTTNINVYRCPPANILQAVFVTPGTTTSKSVRIVSITAPHTNETFYPDVTASTVRLPLNTASPTTTFTFNFENSTQVVTLTYEFASIRPLYRNTCSGTQRIVALASTTNGVTIANNQVLFPAVTNIRIEVP